MYFKHNGMSATKINIKMIFEKTGSKGVGRIHLYQDRHKWWAVVKAVMNFWIPKKAESFATS